MPITLPDYSRLTPDSIEHALDLHWEAGNIARWHNWHEARPSRKRPMYTVTLAGGPPQHVIHLATLHEAHALCAGLVSSEQAAKQAATPCAICGKPLGTGCHMCGFSNLPLAVV